MSAMADARGLTEFTKATVLICRFFSASKIVRMKRSLIFARRWVAGPLDDPVFARKPT